MKTYRVGIGHDCIQADSDEEAVQAFMGMMATFFADYHPQLPVRNPEAIVGLLSVEGETKMRRFVFQIKEPFKDN